MQENITKSVNNTESQEEQSIDIKAIFYIFLANWYWFLISAVVAFAVATLYLYRTTPVYTRTAKVLVKSEEKGKSIMDANDFSSMGLIGNRINIANELITFNSIDNIREAARRLHLDMNYTIDGRFHPVLLYDNTLPVNVDLLGGFDNVSASFDMHLDKGKGVKLSKFALNGDEVQGECMAKFGDTVNTPIGLMSVRPTDYLNAWREDIDVIHVRHSAIENTARQYASQLSISLTSKSADVMTISVNNISKKRADDFINMLIAVYNNNWLKDKNQIMVSTSMFIDDRLSLIEQELGNVDSDISTYKSENLLPDVNAVSRIYLSENSATTTRILEINNQISITRYIRNMLAGEMVKDQLLPVNSGINSSNIESQINSYNSMMLRRNSLVANSSEENPLVVDLDKNLAALREAIISSIDNQLVTLDNQLKSLQGTERQISQRLAANPGQAKYLLSVERQQKVKESLYLYLLQKREENQLSQAFTAYNTRVIEQPHGSSLPTSPKVSLIRLIALIIGLAIPALILFLREQFNTSIRGRKDLESLSLPFVGEIPLAYSAADQKKKKKEAKKKREEQKDNEVKEGFAGGVVVKKGSRNVINEAFRVFRTNLEFMSKDKESNIFMFTSFNPGSGKSFIAINSAIALAIKEKKVLVIDGDLRHASLSAYIFSPKKGIANYLARQEEDINQLILPSQEYSTLSYLPVGTIPPNPTELLEDERFGELIARFGKEYDYVLIDCPPVDIVADPQIINKYVDRTIFVVRVGLMERSMVPELENIYTQNKFKNMCLVLNGSVGNDGRYGGGYGYRYGYRYGYKYGYNGKYGYHSGYYGNKGNGYYHEDDE
jgi:capsular exopolysaccharide synthesis family protein